MAKITFIFEDTTVNGIPAVHVDVNHDIDLDSQQEVTPAIFTSALVIDTLETIKAVQNDMFAEHKKAAEMSNKTLEELLAAYKPTSGQKPN